RPSVRPPFPYTTLFRSEDLADNARALVAAGKGILAIDESGPTIARRFADVGLPNSEANRRAYRELLITAPGLAGSISGVALSDRSEEHTSELQSRENLV